MDAQELERILNAATAAANHARDVRASYRKRAGKGDRQRQTEIQFALNRLKRTMQPIRSSLARIPYERRKNPDASLDVQRAKLLEASDALQRERRKLWKMQERRK